MTPEPQPTRPPPPPPGSPDWRRIRATVFPILLLFVLLFVLGRMHIDLANGFTAPRLASDGTHAIVFYDEGAHDSAFYFRRTEDGVKFEEKRRVSGVLAGVCFTPRLLVTLNGDPADAKSKWFYRVLPREQGKLKAPRWSQTFKDPELGLTHPRHVAALGESVFLFGTDEAGALRVAALSSDDNLLPLTASLPGAGVPPEPATSTLSKVKKPRLTLRTVTSAQVGNKLVLVWRVPQKTGGDANGPGQVRWTTFDGERFDELQHLDVDLHAVTVLTAPGFLDEVTDLAILGVKHGDETDTIRIYAPGQEGSVAEVGQVPYTREGFTTAGIQALSGGVIGERLLVLAQIGGVIRYTTRHEGSWSEWEDLARTPVEQRAVVYGWFLSLLFLSGLLVVQGYRGYRARVYRRRRRRATPAASLEEYCAPVLERAAAGATPAPAEPAPAEPSAAETGPVPADEPMPAAAPLMERLVAFVVDVGAVLVVGSIFLALFPEVVQRAEQDPRVRLALAAWFLVGLVSYFSLLESLFARTIGKRLLGLEVQQLDGGRPGLASCVYRNLFRIELLLPPTYLVAPFSLMVMLLNDHRQRPGDLVAQTCVRRSAPNPGSV